MFSAYSVRRAGGLRLVVAGIVVLAIWGSESHASRSQAATIPSACVAYAVNRAAMPEPRSALLGIAALSARNVWAVGFVQHTVVMGVQKRDVRRALIEHWDGTRWQVVVTPPGGEIGMVSIAAVSAHDIWAVGVHTGSTYNARAWHWDGARWCDVTASSGLFINGSNNTVRTVSVTVGPAGQVYVAQQYFDTSVRVVRRTPSGWDRVFYAPAQAVLPDVEFAARYPVLTVPQPSEAWLAVGGTVLHWTGQQWTRANSPFLTYIGVLNRKQIGAFAMVSARDIWAVGGWVAQTSSMPVPGYHYDLILGHWNGHAWTAHPSPFTRRLPDEDEGEVYPDMASALATDDIWLGHANEATHWDGHHWQRHDLPLAGATLFGLVALSSHDVWGVGTRDGCSAFYNYDCQTTLITVHWNGMQWQEVPNPLASAAQP